MKEKLSNVCTFYTGTGFPTNYQGKEEGDLPFYKVGDIANNVVAGNIYLNDCNNYISYNEAAEIKGSILPRNTIVFAKIGEALKLNRRAITSRECLVDNNAMGIAPVESKLKLMYFYYFMRNLKLETLAESTTVPSVRKSKLEEFVIDLPDLNEQKVIEETLGKVNEVIISIKKQLNKYDELIKSRFVEMFGDPVRNSMCWDIKRLSELSEKITNGNTPKGGSQVYVDSGILFFRSQNVWKNKLEMDDIAYIDEKTHRSMRESSLKYGDILITKTGRINTDNSSLGRSALYLGIDDAANINGHVYLVRLKEGISRQFVLNILISDIYREYIRGVCVGGIDKRQLNRNHIEDFPIIQPPTFMQKEFVDFVVKIDKLKVAEQKRLEKLQLLFDSLMQQYFG